MPSATWAASHSNIVTFTGKEVIGRPGSDDNSDGQNIPAGAFGQAARDGDTGRAPGVADHRGRRCAARRAGFHRDGLQPGRATPPCTAGTSRSTRPSDLGASPRAPGRFAHGQFAQIYVRYGALTSPPRPRGRLLAPVLLLAQAVGAWPGRTCTLPPAARPVVRARSRRAPARVDHVVRGSTPSHASGDSRREPGSRSPWSGPRSPWPTSRACGAIRRTARPSPSASWGRAPARAPADRQQGRGPPCCSASASRSSRSRSSAWLPS